MRLIRACLCGIEMGFAERTAPTGLKIARCDFCNVEHQLTDQTPDELDALYRGEYHAALDRHPGCIPYAQRYEHDRKVSAIRLAKYREVFPSRVFERNDFHAIDIGAANGAWVDELNEYGFKATGVDPDPAMTRATIELGTLESLVRASAGPFTLVTLHDVLEHMLHPREEVIMLRRIIAPGGAVVVDVPDVFTPGGEHHYKAEHLWYFTRDAVCRMLWTAGFRLHCIDAPLPGKFVVYGLAP